MLPLLASVVALAAPHPLAAATDPLVPVEWWRPAVGADDAEPPGPGKPVTVVDSGLDVAHPEFAARANTVLLNRQTTTAEDEDHGTEVSSVAAAPSNGIGIVGVFPQAELRSWDASPRGLIDEGAAIEGILTAAERGPGVINLSFGGFIRDPLMEQAVLFAIRSGSVVVAAAGNEGDEPMGFPAAFPHVLTIGAFDEGGAVAEFSSRGPAVDLVAPGVDIPVAVPLRLVPSGYGAADGTSFAAPIVSGAAAWIWTVRPDLDNTQLAEILRRSARDVGPRGFDATSGYGLLDIPRALVYTAPPRDPQEPNEDADQIEAGGVFERANPPLTTSTRLSASLTGRADRYEDPVDLYRTWAAGARTLNLRTTGAVSLRILPRSTRGVRATPLALGRGSTASFRNRGSGRYVYVEVRPSNSVRDVEYTLRITTARR